MLKFLRKYNAIILVFGGVLLMITFLIPQALQQLGQGAGAQVLGTIDGRAISGKEYLRAQRELEIINRIGLGIVRFESVEHWLLLTLEADQHDLVGGQLDGRNFLSRYATEVTSFLAAGRSEEERAERADQMLASLNAAVAEVRYPADQIYAALGKASGVWRLLELHEVALPLSTPEAWSIGMDLFDTATADIVAISADDFAPDPATLSDGAIQSHFEQYGAQRPSENDFRIGYRQPQAMRLDMLRIDRSALRDAIEVDPIELRLHFDKLQKRGVMVGQTYEDNRESVRASYLTERSQELLDELTREVNRELLKSRVGMDFTGGYAELPDDWASRRPSMESLAAVVRAKMPSPEVAQAIVQVLTDDGTFLAPTDLAQLPAVLTAQYRINERASVPFVQYVLGVRELGNDDRYPLQVGIIPTQPLRVQRGTDEGDVIWVRIVEVREEGPAESWRELEDQVRRDLASLEGYNALLARQAEYEGLVAQRGVAEIMEQNLPSATYNIGGKITRQAVRLADGSTPFPEANNKPFRDAVIDMMRAWDPALDVATLPLEDRTVAITDPATQRLTIGQVIERAPMTLEQYSRNAASIVSRALSDTADPNAIQVLSYDAVKKRLNYRPAGTEDEQDAQDETEDEAPGDASE